MSREGGEWVGRTGSGSGGQAGGHWASEDKT